jgi:hypothetical protein
MIFTTSSVDEGEAPPEITKVCAAHPDSITDARLLICRNTIIDWFVERQMTGCF